jgi:hypothetical protein
MVMSVVVMAVMVRGMKVVVWRRVRVLGGSRHE